MNFVFAAVGLLAACSAPAQAACRYSIFIYQETDDAPKVYAISGQGQSVAVEVRGCGDASVLADPAAVVTRLAARRDADDLNLVTVEGRGSRVELGECSPADQDEDEDVEDDGRDAESLVVVEDFSAVQVRRTLNTLDSVTPAMREEMVAALALRTCGRR
ncbi:MAG: hypothetical protein AB7P07_12875 [Hyphomonadaceae bacterium]